MNKRERYVSFLKEEGYLPQMFGDDMVTFKKEGGTYVILSHEEDETYLQIIYPNFWSISDDAERLRLFEACNSATETTKGVKFLLTKANSWAIVELFLPEFDAFKLVFTRCLSALQLGVKTVVELMRASDTTALVRGNETAATEPAPANITS
jgi:hypothetical protein